MKDKSGTDVRDPHKNTDLARKQLEKIAIELLTDKKYHYTHSEVAKIILERTGVKMSRQWVTEVNCKHQKMWQESIKKDIETHLEGQLTKLQFLYDEMHQLYLESSQDDVTITTEAVQDENQKNKNQKDKKVGKGKVRKVVKTRLHDKTILDSMSQIIDKQNRLLGLYKENVEHSGKVVVENRFSSMTMEELRQFIKEHSEI